MKRWLLLLFCLSTLPVMSANVVLMISLAMPDDALKLYFTEAHNLHIPVVIRGFYYNNDKKSGYIGNFKDTVGRINHLLKNRDHGGLSVDPLIFRAFNVRAVPALAVYDDDLSCIRRSRHLEKCPEDSFDIVYGNLPIKQMLKIISNHTKSNKRKNIVDDIRGEL